jgi:hypothetical protein
MPAAVSQQPNVTLDSSDLFPHLVEFNPSPKTLTWERLENRRLERLGLGAKRYSRHFQRFQREPTTMSNPEFSKPIMETKVEGGKTQQYVIIGGEKVLVNNSLAPFYTEEKPTCGFLFSSGTDNKKKTFGMPPSDLVKWRSFVQ